MGTSSASNALRETAVDERRRRIQQHRPYVEAAEPLAQDDDGGDDVNAFLLFTPEESGDYIVRATSAGEERTLGSYQLRVGEKP